MAGGGEEKKALSTATGPRANSNDFFVSSRRLDSDILPSPESKIRVHNNAGHWDKRSLLKPLTVAPMLTPHLVAFQDCACLDSADQAMVQCVSYTAFSARSQERT